MALCFALTCDAVHTLCRVRPKRQSKNISCIKKVGGVSLPNLELGYLFLRYVFMSKFALYKDVLVQKC